VVPALGPAGHWQVDISGWADAGGDLFTAFDWTTTGDSTVTPSAHGQVGFLAPPSLGDPTEEAYPPSLYVIGLEQEPDETTAELVLSGGSASATFPMRPSRDVGCPRDGALSFAGDDPTAPVDLHDLGDPPYSYEVHLTMDGRSYTGTGQWPDDLTPPSSNTLSLTWSPPLPAWDGSDGSDGSGTSGHEPEVETGSVTPFVLQLEDGPVELAPWTYCLGNVCVDGMPADQPHDVGAPGEVAFTFDRPGWEFTATFRKPGDCARMITLPVERTGPTEFLLRPIGPAGDWYVDLFGRGDGDAITTFRWHTPVDGRLPEGASGTVGVLAGHDGDLDSYGVELNLTDLAEQPDEAAAVITVTSADGRTATIEPRRLPRCYSQGDVYFKAPRSQGLAATRIGEGPFTYTVYLTLDGRTHVGTGEWPTDTNPEMTPHVPLTWEPALPSYGG
jgi:hypothetical protein